jgi:DNA-binding MarR family transcriptional regulator
MNTETQPDPLRELILLEEIEHDPDVSQASLAAQLGVAVGTVNWHLKRLIAKGYIKVKRAQRQAALHHTPEDRPAPD